MTLEYEARNADNDIDNVFHSQASDNRYSKLYKSSVRRRLYIYIYIYIYSIYAAVLEDRRNYVN